MTTSSERVVAALSEPGFYGCGVARVDVVQTHISWVFLAGDDVYKVKKPVRFPFLDFSDLARRRYFCHEEVRLNRRLAPDVYRGVVGIKPEGETLVLCAEDDTAACEVAVHMRRLPHNRLLPALLATGEADAAVIETIVARLVRFHCDADSGPEVRAAGEPERLLEQMGDDFDEMRRFRGRTIDAVDDDRIRAFCLEGVAARTELLRARIAAGRVRDGHGDLHAEHICLRDDADGGLAIFDCIEFNPAFRRRDVAAEIAFLAMDLQFRGHPALGRRLVELYAVMAQDADLPDLIPLFACHRAYIRGKVDSLKSEEPEVAAPDRKAAHESAVRHFALAARYAWSDTPGLIVVHGLSGTGKSTLARSLAERTGFAHHSSDRIRKQIAGLEPTARVGPEREDWLYSGEMSARTYDAMYGQGEEDLRAGKGVILDATFQRRVERDRARLSAVRTGRPVLFVECTAPEEVVLRRLRARTAAGDDPSDADERVFRAQQRNYETHAADEEADCVRVDTSGEIDLVVRKVEDEFLAHERRVRTALRGQGQAGARNDGGSGN